MPSETQIPTLDGIHWIVASMTGGARDDVSQMISIDLPFIDLVASADVIVGKDSYGTVVEAACAGTKLVMVPRRNWPETSCLIDWAAANCTFALAEDGFKSFDSTACAINKVLGAPGPTIVEPTGIEEAVAIIAAHCDL